MSDSPIFFRQIIIRKLVVDLAIEEKVIEKVLLHAFNGARKAFHEHGSIEISGFGKFVLGTGRIIHAKSRLTRRLKRWKEELESSETDEKMKQNRRYWIARAERDLGIIKKLKNED